MSRTDLCDKWNYREITPENFPLVVDSDRISEPGFLSVRTVAKLISYCLLIAESTAESLPALSGNANIFADHIMAAIVDHGREFESALGENSPWSHFLIAARHPIVRWGVNNALMNRWGTKEYPPVGEEGLVLPPPPSDSTELAEVLRRGELSSSQVDGVDLVDRLRGGRVFSKQFRFIRSRFHPDPNLHLTGFADR